jgi:predicted nucleic acid-binding Zn ribbon protein
VIRCEHCGSALPDGAIFCGECGRAVTTSAARRTAPVEPADRATPPPLQQPDTHGRAPERDSDAGLPESTLDPATRAWLTGTDDERPAPRPTEPRPDLTPRSAPTHVHGSGTGLGDWTGRPADTATDTPAEPTLDPDAFPAETVAPQDDPEIQRTAAWAPADPDRAGEDVAALGAAPVWQPQDTPAAPPAGPSWWIGRAPSAVATDATASDAATVPGTDRADDDHVAAFDDGPRPGDTAAFQPVVERRAPRPAPLVAPGSQSATCHVCGHALEPDDIFCEECGSVRPAVTAAFTGPVMPLPLTRPDWAADEDALRSAVSDAHQLTDEADGLDPARVDPARDDPARDDADAVSAGELSADEVPADDAPADEVPADSAAPSSDRCDDGAEHDGAEHDPAADDGAEHGHAADDGAAQDDDGAPVADVAPSDEHARPDTAAPRQEAHPPSAAPLPPVAAPLPSSEHTAEPVDGNSLTSSADQHEDEDEDVEATRIVSRAPELEPFLLHFSTGERLGVHGSALLGRLPRPESDEHFDDLLTIRDPGKSVSKTHLELGRDGDDLWVSDRHSGNGTVIRHIDGSIRRCEPGRRYRVERGARVDVGEQFFLLQ